MILVSMHAAYCEARSICSTVVPHDLRFSLGSSDVLPRVVALLSDGKEHQDTELNRLMRSGVLEPVRDDRKRADSADTSQEQHVVNPQ